AGYQTAIIGKWHLGSTPTGFDYFEVMPGQGQYYNPQFKKNSGTVNANYTGYNSDLVADFSLEWLRSGRDKNKPFMLMTQFKAPHANWEPPVKYLDKYDGDTLPEPGNLFDDYSYRGSAINAFVPKISYMSGTWLQLQYSANLNAEQKAAWDAAFGPKNAAFQAANLQGDDLIRWKYQRYIKNYLRCIASVDDNVGRLLNYLDDNGLKENTVVIYSSDQGFYLG
ncbi:MAG: sulfatase-like hydrolase/transferase, partial [Planctomycetes bacterium]|nr:sulfatase-like hydrolase/transferase [Planctomycetota bacterium]